MRLYGLLSGGSIRTFFKNCLCLLHEINRPSLNEIVISLEYDVAFKKTIDAKTFRIRGNFVAMALHFNIESSV